MKIIRILKLVADDVASIFPYFLAFYLISLFVSIFFTAWRGYFYWPAFHASVIGLALISLGSWKFKNFWKGVLEVSGKAGDGSFEIVNDGTILRRVVGVSRRGKEKGKIVVGRMAVIFYAVVMPVRGKVLFWKKNLGRSGYIKLAVMLVILAFSLFQGIYVIDFFVLLFGLLSALFVLDMRISAGCALVLLAACPFLLVFNQNGIAEAVAVYAYYFLVIAVFTGIGDYIKVMHRPPGNSGSLNMLH